MSEVLQPHELLNQAVKQGPVDIDGQKLYDLSSNLFVLGMKPLFDGDPKMLSDANFKQLSGLCIGAAAIHLEKLKGGKK